MKQDNWKNQLILGDNKSEKAIEVSRNRLEKISAHPFLTIIKTKEKN